MRWRNAPLQSIAVCSSLALCGFLCNRAMGDRSTCPEVREFELRMLCHVEQGMSPRRFCPRGCTSERFEHVVYVVLGVMQLFPSID
jgi:hypothetical protein